MRRAFVLTILTTTAVLALGAAIAHACYQPKVVLGKSQASGGEGVPYTVTGLESGSKYTLTINGRTVASGTDAAPSGSFAMPDLGARDQAVDVHMVAGHPQPGETHPQGAEEYSHDAGIAYLAPAAATTQPPAQQPAESPTQQPAESPSATGGQPGVGGGGGPGRGPGSDPGSGRPSGPQGPGAEGATSPVAAPGSPAGAPVSIAAATGTTEAQRAAESTTAEARSESRSETDEGAAIAVPSRPAVGDDSIVESDPIAVAAVALAVALLIAAGGALLRAVREPRRAPDGRLEVAASLPVPHEIEREARWRGLAIEAELQEVIAEARARELVADRDVPRTDVDAPPPEGPERAGIGAAS